MQTSGLAGVQMRGFSMSITSFGRKAGAALAAAILASMLAGCISDAGVAPSLTSSDSGRAGELRYYGGPKSPMWPAQP